MFNIPRSVKPDLSELHWLPIRQRIDFKIAVLVFKVIHGLAPVYLRELLRPYRQKRALRSNLDCFLLQVPRSDNGSGNRSFKVKGPRVWNSLPANVRARKELYTFKKLLKTTL